MTMDPLEVIRKIWQQRWFALPALLIAIAACVAVYAFGPREYQATVSYAIVDPRIPSAAEIEADPSLGKLNSNNPYLRSADSSLIGDVVITRLNAPATVDELKSLGLGTDFTAAPGINSSGSIVEITASGSTPRQSLNTVDELGKLFQQTLRSIQTVDGADDRYLYTSLEAAAPDRATEKLSSRLRTVIIAAVAGIILVFAAVSLGTWRDSIRRRRRAAAGKAAATESGEPEGPAHENAPETAVEDDTAAGSELDDSDDDVRPRRPYRSVPGREDARR
jgi:capsular polysaccharide biosynthesis protein